MERLTVNDLNKVCYDPWELCGMDNYCKKGCHEEGGCTKGCHILKMYRKLAEYEDLEEQGKLLKLPAAIGDEVFFVFMDCPKDYKEEYCRDHEGSCENCHHRVPEIMSRDFRMLDISNMDKIFATREEAEAVLKELEGRNENTSTNT